MTKEEIEMAAAQQAAAQGSAQHYTSGLGGAGAMNLNITSLPSFAERVKSTIERKRTQLQRLEELDALLVKNPDFAKMLALIESADLYR